VLKAGKLKPPFERMSYEQAMQDYSIDRPDLRSRELRLTDLTEWARGCSFNAFKGVAEKGGLVKGLRCPGMAEQFSTGQLKNLERDAKGMGATGLANLKVAAGGLEGGIARFFPESEQQAMIAAFGAKPDDLLLICAHEKEKIVHAVMHNMRVLVAEKLGLSDPNKFAITWVIDFPLFEYRDEDEKLFASHHPFTLPQDVDKVREFADAARQRPNKCQLSHDELKRFEAAVARLGSDSIKQRVSSWSSNIELDYKGLAAQLSSKNASSLAAHVPEISHLLRDVPPTARLRDAGITVGEVLALRNNQYDLVINGIEIAGGSIRMHRTDWQSDVFELIGITEEEAQKKFGFLLSALAHGAPPHGGIACGVDRFLMLLLGLDNIQDVIAFPKSATGRDLMIDTPNDVEPALLKELGIEIKAKPTST
jgi:aspartyl-tRNA synthetase